MCQPSLRINVILELLALLSPNKLTTHVQLAKSILHFLKPAVHSRKNVLQLRVGNSLLVFLIIICFSLSLPLLPHLILNLKTFLICLSKGSCSRASCARFDFPPSHLLHQRAKVGLRCRQDVHLPESEQSPGPSCSSSQPRGEAGQRGTESFRLQKTSNIIESPDTIALRLFRSTPDVW